MVVVDPERRSPDVSCHVELRVEVETAGRTVEHLPHPRGSERNY
jgi:hypothetical protein